MSLHKRLLVAGVVGAALASTATAEADITPLGSINLLGMHHSMAFSEPTLRARRTYEIIASLPVASSIDQTYDLRGFVAPVVDAQVKVAPNVVLGFPLGISGKHVFTADFGDRTRVAFGPSDGFGRGGLFSLKTDF